uniref:Uncharacterized protein n=1 Tax=Panagrolaimus sp. ES5 TaxID=591445 RepID=A0AC34G0Y8_9BILA
MLNKKFKEKEEDGDHDGVMSKIGTPESVRRALKSSSKPTYVQNCMVANIDPDLKKSSFFDGADIVRMNDEDFVFLMEDKGIEILRKTKYWKFDVTYHLGMEALLTYCSAQGWKIPNHLKKLNQIHDL